MLVTDDYCRSGWDLGDSFSAELELRVLPLGRAHTTAHLLAPHPLWAAPADALWLRAWPRFEGGLRFLHCNTMTVIMTVIMNKPPT